MTIDIFKTAFNNDYPYARTEFIKDPIKKILLSLQFLDAQRLKGNTAACNIILDILSALIVLSKREKEIILEYYYQGKTQEEIAEEKSISRQRVATILKTSEQKLLKKISGEIK